MNEKVKLPKEVCNALDMALSMTRNFDFTILEMTQHGKWGLEELEILNDQNVDLIMRALVLGYEPELTVEEYLEDLYHNPPNVRGHEGVISYRKGIKDTLKALKLDYDWIGEAP